MFWNVAVEKRFHLIVFQKVKLSVCGGNNKSSCEQRGEEGKNLDADVNATYKVKLEVSNRFVDV